jgi:hypothetical protein
MNGVNVSVANGPRARSGTGILWSQVLRFATVTIVIALAAGCASRTPDAEALRRSILYHQGPVRVTITDGRIVVLEKPAVVNDSLTGIVRGKPPRALAVALNEIRSVEPVRADRSRVASRPVQAGGLPGRCSTGPPITRYWPAPNLDSSAIRLKPVVQANQSLATVNPS